MSPIILRAENMYGTKPTPRTAEDLADLEACVKYLQDLIGRVRESQIRWNPPPGETRQPGE